MAMAISATTLCSVVLRDVYSYHVDSALIEASILFPQLRAASKRLRNDEVTRRIDDFATRAGLSLPFRQREASTTSVNFSATPAAICTTRCPFAHFNLWRITEDWPGNLALAVSALYSFGHLQRSAVPAAD